jgi:class 3 adenylate cyclase
MALPQIKSIKNEFKGLSISGLKIRIVIPFLVLIALLIVTLMGFSLANRQFSLELLLIIGAAFLAVVGLGVMLAWQIDRRVKAVIAAAEKVAEGDFSVRIDDNQHDDEIGRFVRVFNQMVTNLDHLHHSRDLLSRTMSPAVRQSLIEKGLDFRGLTQVVSILFVDIRGFTPITEMHHQNTEHLVIFLNDYYITVANQIHSGGGIIGKYGGDSILAYFGAPNPESPEKSSTAALLTALALQDAIEELSDRWVILGFPSIRVGIGISIGRVVAGPIGSEEQFEYTVIGDAVNLAARLQDLTRNVAGLNIIISSDVYEALEQKIRDQIQVISAEQFGAMDHKELAQRPVQFVDLGEVLVKGKKGPVHVYGIPE